MTYPETPSPGSELPSSSQRSSHSSWRLRQWRPEQLKLLHAAYSNSPSEESIAKLAEELGRSPHALWMKAHRMGWAGISGPGKKDWRQYKTPRESLDLTQVCSIQYCGRTARTAGLCWKHHSRAMRCR